MSNILLSILIPTVQSREGLTRALIDHLLKQVGDLPAEVLWLGDNRKRRLGKKREALMKVAKGTYICHLDDDDFVTDDFIPTVVEAIRNNMGKYVISYDSESTLVIPEWNTTANPFRVRTSISYENEAAKWEGGTWHDIKRKPWQWCTWHSVLASRATCQDGNVDEDNFWLKQLWPDITPDLEHHIDRVLHYYRFDSNVTICKTN